MNSFFLNYLTEATIGLILFLLIYRILLKNETNFSFRRYYLLASLALSIGFPLITISGASSLLTLSEVIPAYWLPEITIGKTSANQIFESGSFSIWSIIFFLYLTGVVWFTLKLFSELYQLLRLSKRASHHNDIVEVEMDIVAFSFFQYIFIGNATTLSSIDKLKIIDHERVHQRLGHSYDNLAVEVVRILFWFNPLIKQYKKELSTVHEFQADEHVIHDKQDIQTYCNLLARVALKSADFSLANHFNNSVTLKRITMMNTTKQKLQWWKQAAMIPIAASFFFLVACQDQILAQQEKPKQAQLSEKNDVYTVVDEMPAYEGGFDKMTTLIAKNMTYPEKARKGGVEGTVFVSFIVEKNGTIGDVNVMKGVSSECDAEALRVVRLLNTWTPGKQGGKIVRVSFVLPIKFKL